MGSTSPPKIVYGSTTFIPQFAPRKLAAYEPEYVRFDNIADSGVQETIFQREDDFLTLNFESIPASEVAGWKAFLAYAGQGQFFTYYPDSTAGGNNNYYLVDKTPKIEYVSPGWYQLKGMRFRQRLPWP